MQNRVKAGGMLAFAGLVAFSASSGSAATLGGLLPDQFGAGSAVVTACDSDGIAVAYTMSGTTATHAVLSGISAACAGGGLQLTLAGSTGASVGAGSVTVSATSHTLLLSPQPAASAVSAVHVAITGP